MGLLSFFKRGNAAAPAAKPVADTADAVQVLRVRARHRLIGAAVLVAFGVIGFPLVFETQPRPIPVDLPIDIPRKDAARTALVIPAPLSSDSALALLEPGEEVLRPSAAPVTALPVRPAAVEVPASVPVPVPTKAVVLPEKPTPVLTDKPPEKAIEKAIEKALDKPAEKTPEKSASKAIERLVEKPPEKPLEKQTSPEADRVQALLEGKPAEKKAADTAVRFILQVGAYADGKAAQDARMKVEKFGLKTYIQAVETADGRRIRVRVGPFASRDEADKAAGKLRGTGLSTVVLTL
jgi:DedD protein